MMRAFPISALVLALLSLGCGPEPRPKLPEPAPNGAPEAPPPTAENVARDPANASGESWANEPEVTASKPRPEPSAGPNPEDGKVETRTMEVIAQVVKDQRKPVRECFDQAKKSAPDLKGDMIIFFVIDPDGRVKKAELNEERSTLKTKEVVDCAIKFIRTIKFPPSSRSMETSVNYPYNFN